MEEGGRWRRRMWSLSGSSDDVIPEDSSQSLCGPDPQQNDPWPQPQYSIVPTKKNVSREVLSFPSLSSIDTMFVQNITLKRKKGSGTKVWLRLQEYGPGGISSLGSTGPFFCQFMFYRKDVIDHNTFPFSEEKIINAWLFSLIINCNLLKDGNTNRLQMEIENELMNNEGLILIPVGLSYYTTYKQFSRRWWIFCRIVRFSSLNWPDLFKCIHWMDTDWQQCGSGSNNKIFSVWRVRKTKTVRYIVYKVLQAQF